jgi:hypothetical protein
LDARSDSGGAVHQCAIPIENEQIVRAVIVLSHNAILGASRMNISESGTQPFAASLYGKLASSKNRLF